MNKYKAAFEAILKKSNVVVQKTHQALLDKFLESKEVGTAFDFVEEKQKFIMASWMQNLKIQDILDKHVPLPNATTGKAYEYVFDFEKLGMKEIGEHFFNLPEGCGLVYDADTFKLSGKPQAAGDYVLDLNFRLQGVGEPLPEFKTKTLKLIVNPDPKSLWRNIPSQEGEYGAKPDDLSGCEMFGERKLVVASKRGRSHAHDGRFRDDNFDFAYLEDSGWGIIAVADGAGSAKFSRKGSEIACASVVNYFKSQPAILHDFGNAVQELVVNHSDELTRRKLGAVITSHIGQAAFQAHHKIREEAIAYQAEIKDYSTTLIFSLVKKLDSRHVVCTFWVGDGGVGIYDQPRDKVILMGTPDSGEFAGQTRFLTMPDIFATNSYVNRVQVKIVPDFTALVLMTDGITDPKFQTDGNLSKVEKWDELWQDLQGANDDKCAVDFTQPIETVTQQLMNWLDFWSPGNHDDRTIAILY